MAASELAPGGLKPNGSSSRYYLSPGAFIAEAFSASREARSARPEALKPLTEYEYAFHVD